MIPTPSYDNGLVYLMSGFSGAALLAVRLEGAAGDLDGTEAIAWTHDQDTSFLPSGLAYEDTYYFLKGNAGILTILDARSGEALNGPQRLDARPAPRARLRAAGDEHARGEFRRVAGDRGTAALPQGTEVPILPRGTTLTAVARGTASRRAG